RRDWSLLEARTIEVALRRLAAEARRTGLTGGAVGPEDAAAQALDRFISAARDGRVVERTAAAYLLQTARYAAIDSLRRQRFYDLQPRDVVEDDAMLRLIDASATAQTVISAL